MKSKIGISLVSLVIVVIVMTILTGVIVVTSLSSMNENSKVEFATELLNVQNAVDEYYYEKSDYPLKAEVIFDITNINEKEQFQKEETTSITLYELDMETLGMSNLKYGTKTTEDDIYAVSPNTGTVYYLKGFEYDGEKYYTIVSKLYDNMNIDLDILSSDEIKRNDVIFKISNRKITSSPVEITVKLKYNASNVKITTEKQVSEERIEKGYRVYDINKSGENLNGNYTVKVEYTLDGEAKTAEYAVTNYLQDNGLIITRKVEGNYVDITIEDKNNKGIEKVKYENADIADISYFKNFGRSANGNVVRVKLDSDYTIYVKDKTGNENIIKKQKVYMKQLGEGLYFKETDYIDKIKTVKFVNYIDTTSAIKTYDVTDTTSALEGSIMCWVDPNYNLYIGSWDNMYAKDLGYAFKKMTALTSVDFGSFKSAECESLYEMCMGCTALETIDMKDFVCNLKGNTLYYTFGDCNSLKYLNISNLNTKNVTHMATLFYNCESLTSLDIKNFDTSNVTNMDAMFYNCKSLKTLDASGFNTSKVTSMNKMFGSCKVLESLKITNFDTSNVTDMELMFCDCNLLKTLDVSSFNTSKVTNMNTMFAKCMTLKELDISNFDTSNVTNMQSMFSYTNNLDVIYVGSLWNTSNASIDNMFLGSKINSVTTK